MAEEKERLQANLLSKIRTEISVEKYLSQLYFEGSNSGRERESLCGATPWRDLSQQGRVVVPGCQERCNRMRMSPNALFFSFSQLQLLDCFGCLSTTSALSSWPRSWSEVKKLSWPPHVSLLRLAPGKGVRQFDVWGESSFKRPLPSYDKSDFSSRPLKVFKLAESFCRNCQKYHNSTNSVRWLLGISDLVEQLKCVLCQILDLGGREENYLLFAWFLCLCPMCLFRWLSVWFNTGYIWVIERLMKSGRRRRNIYFDFFFDRRVLKSQLHKHCLKVFFSFVLSTASLLFPDMVKILYWDIQVLKNSQWRSIIQIFGRFWPQLFWDNTFCWIDFG